MASPVKKLGNVTLSKTVFFLCDMQERFRPAIKYFKDIAEVSKRLVDGSKILDIPLVATEQIGRLSPDSSALQRLRSWYTSHHTSNHICGLKDLDHVLYPKGLGKTVEELDVQHARGVFPKTRFSMLIPEVEAALPTLCDGQVEHVVLFGIEAHVCIQQTVIDLLERGYQVHVVADATSSRSQMDRLLAFERFRHSGAIVTTSEAILLQLVGDKDHPKFKEIQGLIKVSAPDSGLVSNI